MSRERDKIEKRNKNNKTLDEKNEKERVDERGMGKRKYIGREGNR